VEFNSAGNPPFSKGGGCQASYILFKFALYIFIFNGQRGGARNRNLIRVDIRSSSGYVLSPGSRMRREESDIYYVVEKNLPLLNIEDASVKHAIEKIIPPEKGIYENRPTNKPTIDNALPS
jgi:hypothetical protein